MKKLRVLVLVHEGLVPPEGARRPHDDEMAPWRTEFDVIAALKKLGHEVRPLGVGGEIGDVRRAVEEFRPHACFNLLVEFHGAGTYDQHVASYLELLRANYTGCNPRGLTLARDKGLAKEILTFHRVRVPRFQVFPVGRKKPSSSEVSWRSIGNPVPVIAQAPRGFWFVRPYAAISREPSRSSCSTTASR